MIDERALRRRGATLPRRRRSPWMAWVGAGLVLGLLAPAVMAELSSAGGLDAATESFQALLVAVAALLVAAAGD